MNPTRLIRLLGLLGLIAPVLACDSPGLRVIERAPTVAREPDDDPPPGATLNPIGPSGQFEHPPIQVLPMSRTTRRLSAEQLGSSIPVLAGTDAAGDLIRWTLEGREATAFGQLGKALGRTDNFGQVTEENLDVSPLYLKFADDMARDVCGKIRDADATKAQDQRVLSPLVSLTAATDGDVDANIRYLSLRFLARRITSDDELLSRLRSVYGAMSPTSPAHAWYGVCVALLMSPEFHIY